MTVELFEIRMQEIVITKTLGVITQTDERKHSFYGLLDSGLKKSRLSATYKKGSDPSTLGMTPSRISIGHNRQIPRDF
jgi:hypothetical protein